MDADALIKLNQGGILGAVAEHLECMIPEAVYTEAVTNGIAAGHADAQFIGGIIDRFITIRQPTAEIARMSTTPMPLLGAGEIAVYYLSLEVTDSFIVSDDTQFLKFLKLSGRLAITPPILIVEMFRQGVIVPAQAAHSLAKMRPLISNLAYQSAMSELED